MHCAQVSRHVVLAVELFVANFAGVGIALEVGGHIVPVKVAGVGVGIVADLAAVRVLWRTLVSAETPDTDRCWVVRRAEAPAAVGVEICQLRLDLLLHLEVHQVGTGTGGAGLRVHAAASGTGPGKLLLRRFGKHARVDQIRDAGEPLGVPEHLGDELVLLLLDDALPDIHHLGALDLEAVPGVARVTAFSVGFLHAEVQNRRRGGKVVVV